MKASGQAKAKETQVDLIPLGRLRAGQGGASEKSWARAIWSIACGRWGSTMVPGCR